jgi:tetratricopeptide (TPR) repeat protein
MESKSDSYSANLNKLVRFFERSEGGYAFATTKVQAHIQTINNELIKRLESTTKKPAFVYFDKESRYSLLEQLKQKTEDCVNGLIVSNITELLFPFLEKGFNEEKDTILELNLSRENLYELETPVLFWLTDEFVSVVSNRAADLYSQRSISTIYFDSVPGDDFGNQELATSFQPKHRSSKSSQDTELKVDLLKKQLKDAEKGKQHLSDIANRLAMPLAKFYSKLDLHAKSINLVNKYKDYINKKNLQILLTLAKIHKKAGRIDEAVSHYEEAITLAKLENNLEGEALGKFHIASIYFEKGQFEEALPYYEEYNNLFKQLYDKNPENESVKNSLAISYSKLGDVYQQLGQVKEAITYFEQESEIFQQLYQDNPGNNQVKNGLAISYSKLGYAYQHIGEYNKAIHCIEKDVLLTKELEKDDNTGKNAKNALAVSYERLGDIYQALGQFDKALHFLILCERLASELYQFEPKNIQFLESVAISNYKLAVVHKKLNQKKGAEKHFVDWQKLLTDLNELAPDSTKYSQWKSLEL